MPTGEQEREEFTKKVLTTLYELWADQNGCEVTITFNDSQKGPAA